MAKYKIEVIANTAPLLGFIKLLELRCETAECPFRLSDISFELARVEQVVDPAFADKVLVTFYPSDAFLDYVAAALARDGDLKRVE
jgi:hypothetical protein